MGEKAGAARENLEVNEKRIQNSWKGDPKLETIEGRSLALLLKLEQCRGIDEIKF